MSDTPVYEELKSLTDLVRKTATIAARIELLNELKAIQKPSKQVLELIKKYERRDNSN